MHPKIPLIPQDLKKLYTGFLIVTVIVFCISTFVTKFNVFTLFANGDSIWKFVSEDFFPPKLPKMNRLPDVMESILVTLALAMASTTIAAILAFVTALFGSEKISPFPKTAKFVRGFATFLRNIPTLVWAFILFSSLGIGTGVGFIAWFLYCIEVNIRASTIVGMVGGGGVGLTLFSYIKTFHYDIAFSIILMIAVMVILVDQLTGKLRKELLK